MSKKILLYLLVGSMLLGLTACGNSGGADKETNKKDNIPAIENIETAYGEAIPEFVTESGLVMPMQHIGDDEYMICVQSTSLEDCEAYVSSLEEKGFQLYSKKEISAGSSITDKNVFYTYTGGKTHIFVSWNPNQCVARVIMTPEGALPALEKPELTADDTVTPSLTQMELDVQGMQYVAQLADGTFVLVDGGMYGLEDTFRLHDFLIDNTPKGKKTTIAAWYFTHPHVDHIELATRFLERYKEEIAIDSFAYNFAADDFTVTGTENSASTVSLYQTLESAIAKNYPDATVYTIHAGQTYYYKGMEIEILQTEEDFYPTEAWTWNNTSANWRMTFGNGKTALFLGDNMKENCSLLATTYGDYIKSDMLQLAHHGQLGGELSTYQLVDPDVVFWACSEEHYNGEDGEEGAYRTQRDYNVYLRDNSIRKRTHYHNGATSTILME